MGRRSFISMTTINRLVSASNRIKREEQANQLIQEQQGKRKELPPSYSLISVDFNADTRVAKIVIEQKNQYRTIERYITQNYTRYPIYSDWKCKTKNITRIIKLTNKELETLYYNPDNYISQFAEEIIATLNREDLFPSWFIKNFLRREFNEKVQSLDTEYNNYYKNSNLEIENQLKLINQNKIDISEISKLIALKEICVDKFRIKINKIDTAPKSIFLNLITLFIYKYLTSDKRKQKLLNKQNELINLISVLKDTISQRQNDIEQEEFAINSLKEQLSIKKLEYEKKREKERINLVEKLNQVQKLSFEIFNNDSFIPLKNFIGFEYEKIIGCYVIHNKENGKCYVGQSKDVIKRLKQHFKGTIPNNVIFAEDYYTSSYKNKEDLFEIRTVRCETKDELDRTEKQLIEEYDAFKSGYNGTKGNK